AAMHRQNPRIFSWITVEAASVAGATFCAEAVAAGMAQPTDSVESQCDTLARRGHFLRANGVEEWPDGSLTARYTFIHTLYQEVLIDRIPPSRLIRLHRHIGIRKESGYGQQARDIAAELAVHFRYSRDIERAVQYLRDAAQNALQRSAHQEAILHLRTGLELLPTLPDSPLWRQHELAMRTALGPALIATQGYTTPEVEHVYTRARELCESMGETTAYFPVLWGLWIFYNNRGSFDTARELADHLLRLAQQDDALLLQAYHALGNTLFWCGEFHAAQEVMDQAIALYDAEQHREQAFRYGGHDPAVCCFGHGAVGLWARGYPDQALQYSQHAVDLAQSLSHPSSLVHALGLAARVHVLRSEPDQVLACAERTIAIATEHGFIQPLATAKLRQGWVWVGRGRAAEGIDQIRQGVNRARSIGAANVLPVYLARLSEAYAQVGQVDEALTAIDDALATIRSCGVREYEAELYRLKGGYLLQLGQEAEAGRYLHRALHTAQHQHAKSWELRAATSLSRLWQSQGKREAARDLLAPVYDWFTEGFDTDDLQHARALLETLL
ncbi:tetratricopeptide repeat protein, partial [Candidatus Entotheonella palauensis]|uniref:tetratricopeptide repeat protein n=1 Tax=Candidatus Entotheonella palauensis TaxID=93172 RepID=UPI0011775886